MNVKRETRAETPRGGRQAEGVGRPPRQPAPAAALGHLAQHDAFGHLRSQLRLLGLPFPKGRARLVVVHDHGDELGL